MLINNNLKTNNENIIEIKVNNDEINKINIPKLTRKN